MRWTEVVALCGLLVLGWPSPAWAQDPSWRPDEPTRLMWDLLEQPCLAVQASLVRTGASPAALPLAWPLVLPVLDAVRGDPTLAVSAAALRARVDAQVTSGQVLDPPVARAVLEELFVVADQGAVAFRREDWSNPAAILMYHVFGSLDERQAWLFAIELAGQPEDVQRNARAQYGSTAIRTECGRPPR